jgi:hypothetical protein
MIANCPYCSMSTGGQHEALCPSNVQRLFSANEYMWKDGHRYRLVLDDPVSDCGLERTSELHNGTIRAGTHFDASVF